MDFLHAITDDKSVGFLNEWNGARNHREKIYISYDSTNKNCQAGEIEMVEYGKANVDIGTPIFNYAIAYDTNNKEPLFYEKYSDSIVDISFESAFEKYFKMHYDSDSGLFVYPEERISVTEKEIELCGYFVIITSHKMRASEALHLYKSRDVSEKLFRGDKTYLGDKSLRVHSSDSAAAKIFVEFIALIIRNKVYTSLVDEMKKLEKSRII